jgi:zinc/manganese transport system ATP-binding protein
VLSAAAQAPAERAARGDPVVSLDGVAAAVGKRTIWRGATFTVRPGSFTAIVGPNGAGKSTLLKLLLGIVPPAAGVVRILGQAPHRGRRHIGYVPQRRALDADTPVRGCDLVALGIDGHRWGFRLPRARHVHDRRLAGALDAVGATPFADRPIGRLSGGEQQRLLLAQALAGDPRVLLLDEPLASLDVRNQVAMAHLVSAIVRERRVATLMVTHDVNPILGVVDQLVYIARGAVVAGTPAEVVTTETLSAVYGAQVEVLRDSHGHVFVVGLEQEAAHAHEH